MKVTEDSVITDFKRLFALIDAHISMRLSEHERVMTALGTRNEALPVGISMRQITAEDVIADCMERLKTCEAQSLNQA